MILLIDTTTADCKLSLVTGDEVHDDQWLAGRQLAKGLLGYISQQLARFDCGFDDVTGIGVLEGPGSFTGLRIGLTVMNTLACSLEVPIVGAQGDAWQATALKRLKNQENDQLVMPHYGAEANITRPRK